MLCSNRNITFCAIMTCHFMIFILLLGLFGFQVEFIKLSFAAEDVNIVRCIDAEREGLIKFKQGLTDPSGRLSSWKGRDCCQWSGVFCSNSSGRVTKLDLRNPFPSTTYGDASIMEGNLTDYTNSCLGGRIGSSLLALEHLDYLDLSLNDFQGIEIPDSFGMFKNLRYLNLSFSSFSGEIPPHLGNLSRLEYLDIYAGSINNQGMWTLQVSDLQWLTGLPSLVYLNLGEVKLDQIGPGWLQAVNKLPSLLELHLKWCYLSDLPHSLSLINFTSLQVLDLSMNSINSSIPFWLFNLKRLRKLDLSANSFSGTIPEDIKNLRSLEFLLAGSGNIQGQIPRALGSLCNLKVLDLSTNNFSGTVDEFLNGFLACPNNSLLTLDLSGNQLEGAIPDSLGILESLEQLKLSSNSFYGSLPESIGNLKSLKELDLSFNELNGTIPPSFGQLAELTSLYLAANPLAGVITEAQLMNLTNLQHVIIRTKTAKLFVFNVTYDWVPPFRFKSLELENCLIGPKFPAWLQVQNELTSVTLKNVGIADTIPAEWFSEISYQLTYLDLSNNEIKGKLPHKLISPNLIAIDLSHNHFQDPLPLWSTRAGHFYLQNNSFTGSIPSNMDKLMPELQYLYLSDNYLSGSIPSSICRIRGLEVLSLRNNHFSGQLPGCWNESQRLWVLDVARNNLTGKIPSSIGLLNSLNILSLSNNALEGELPISLQNCSLVSLDVGGNRISGELPSWIGDKSTDIWVLRLRSNTFYGAIPRQWCNLAAIHILDLGHNNLSGTMPPCLNKLTALIYDNRSITYSNFFRSHRYIYFEEMILVAKGKELEYSRTLQYVNIIDLSGNNLIGGIPEGLTGLTALGTLNLSKNHLTGSVTESIGNLRLLETLDLSDNNLSGPIPQSLSSLTMLSHLNLSNNNLEGRIPSGRQLQTLDDSSIYQGNPLLCGFPLEKRCPGDDGNADAPPPPPSSSSEVDDFDVFSLCVSLGLGFIFGLCGVCCTLWIKESWRKAYFRCFGIK